MGIQGFTKVFKPQHEFKQDFKHFANKSIIIDGSMEVHRAIRGTKDINTLTSSTGMRTQHLNVILCNIINRNKYGIKEAWVFDSGNIYKKEEVERRNKIRLEMRARAAEMEGVELTVENAEKIAKLNKAASSIEVNDIDNVKYLLDLMGIRWTTAPPNIEAEQVCAELCKKEYDYVLSSDTDALVYGAPCVIMRKIHTKNKMMVVYELNKLLEEAAITHDELIKISVVLGTDFNRGGRRGIGPVSVMKKYKTIQLTEAEQKVYNTYTQEVPPIVWNHEKKNVQALIEWLGELSFKKERIIKLIGNY
jgi:flap endonuclease-1